MEGAIRLRTVNIRESERSDIAPENRRDQVNEYVLCAWHELPLWQQDNEWIYSGYRPVSGSLVTSLKSLGYIHNETVNIYSHLLGALFFATAPFHAYRAIYPQYPSTTPADLFVFSTFFFGVALCFLLSATFHIISNHSQRVAEFGNQLDYLGVVLLMWGSTIPTVYYGFYCDPRLQKLYWTMISALAIACAVTTLNPRFRRPELRPYRAAMYTGLGLSAMIFIVHGIMKYGWSMQNQRMSLSWMGLMTAFNLVGAVTYAARVPERWHPRKYDNWGSSHQVLHISVILAAVAHMIGLFRAFDFLHTHGVICD